MTNQANISKTAAALEALFAWEVEVVEVPGSVAIKLSDCGTRARFVGEKGNPEGVGSHLLCREGENYTAAATRLHGMAARNLAKLAQIAEVGV